MLRSALRTTERAKSNRAPSFTFPRHHEFLRDLRASLPIFEHLVHSFYLFEPDRVRLLGHRHVAHNAVGKPLKFHAEFFDFSIPPSERASPREALASSMFPRRAMRGSATGGLSLLIALSSHRNRGLSLYIHASDT